MAMPSVALDVPFLLLPSCHGSTPYVLP